MKVKKSLLEQLQEKGLLQQEQGVPSAAAEVEIKERDLSPKDGAELVSRIDNLEKRIGGVEKTNSAIEDAVGELAARVRGLQEDIQGREEEGAALPSLEEIPAQVEDLATRISELEKAPEQVPSREELEDLVNSKVQEAMTELPSKAQEELKGLIDGLADGVKGDLDRIASRVEKLEKLPSRLDDLIARLGAQEPEPEPEQPPEPESEVGPRPSRLGTRMWVPARGGLPSIVDLHRMFGRNAGVAGKFIRRSKKTKVPTRAGLEYFEATGEIPPEFIEDEGA